jgi:LPXTG-motif cell wall-anchored protein
MSFGTAKSWRLCSPFVALLWAAVTVGFVGTAQAADSHGTDNQSSVAKSASMKAAPPTAPSPDSHASRPPQAADHRSGPSGGGSSGHGSSGHGSGDNSMPQPISNADANTGGANGQCPGGPYCSTRDGTASANGNGGGNATGRPCAGCVGKADNKNPHGQMPGPSDKNAGYECDTNHGIARGNPAHTGCTTPQQQCPTAPCVPTPPCPTQPCVPTPPCPTEPCVSPPIAGTLASNAPAAVSAPQQAQQVLPNTGAPAGLAVLAASALASILAGAYLLRRARRAPLTRM